MIVFVEAGRLGNQIFQYAALRSAFPRDRLLLVGFAELRDMFEKLDATFASADVIVRAARRVRPYLDNLMNRQRVIGLVGENDERDAVISTDGLISGLRYGRTAYFQSATAFDPAVARALQIRPAHAASARGWLQSLSDPARLRVFVHVRRGDYEYFPSPEHPAALPAAWFRAAMAVMRQRFGDPLFVLCSDDAEFIEREFGSIPDVHISRGTEFHDFAVMSQCGAGILSPSSFSWWAAWFARQRSPDACFLAPEFWFGHAQRQWVPAAVAAPFIEYVPAEMR